MERSWGRSHVYKFLVLGRLSLDFAVKKTKVKDHTIGLLLVILFCLFAQENWGESISYDDSGVWLAEQPEFLPVDDAFQFSLDRRGAGDYSLLFNIEDGYYLYKDQFDAWTYRDGERLRVELLLPEGQKKTDEYFGEVNVFYTSLKVAMKNLPFVGDTSTVIVRYQGCADRGLCYPPVEKEINLANGLISDPILLESDEDPVFSPSEFGNERYLFGLLEGAGLASIVLAFFVAGIFLTFTPCVLPMVPIISSIIVGQGQDLTNAKAFRISLAYVLGMAVTFSILGMLVGVFGAEMNIQARLQSPLVISLTAVIFLVLAISMFGFFDIRIPHFIENMLERVLSSQRKSLQYSSPLLFAFSYGALSSLVVSPCITAPLAGALIYISNTGDIVLGGSALFSLAMGMGALLLLIGATGSKWVPKPGVWMIAVKDIFGFVLLAVAIWLLQRVVSDLLVSVLWLVLVVTASLVLIFKWSEHGLRPAKPVGMSTLIIASLFSVAWVSDLINDAPLEGFSANELAQEKELVNWMAVKTVEDVKKVMSENPNRLVVLDVYADWCISCEKMESEVIPRSDIQDELRGIMAIRADVTSNDVEDRRLLRSFGLFGPPTFVFLKENVSELDEFRIQGEVNSDRFLANLSGAIEASMQDRTFKIP